MYVKIWILTSPYERKTQKLQTGTQYHMNYICGKITIFGGMIGKTLITVHFTGITALMSFNNTCLTAFARYLDSSQDQPIFAAARKSRFRT